MIDPKLSEIANKLADASAAVNVAADEARNAGLIVSIKLHNEVGPRGANKLVLSTQCYYEL